MKNLLMGMSLSRERSKYLMTSRRCAGSPRSGGLYMGEDRAEEFGARNGVDGELVGRDNITG